jgi:subtilisin family serine protease
MGALRLAALAAAGLLALALPALGGSSARHVARFAGAEFEGAVRCAAAAGAVERAASLLAARAAASEQSVGRVCLVAFDGSPALVAAVRALAGVAYVEAHVAVKAYGGGAGGDAGGVAGGVAGGGADGGADGGAGGGAAWGVDRANQRLLPLDGDAGRRWSGAGVTVYVLDTGVSPGHSEFLGGRVEVGPSFLSPELEDPLSVDMNGHGSHCSGIAAGASMGAAPGALVVGVKALNRDGQGDTESMIAAVSWVVRRQAVAHGGAPAVVSMSIGSAFHRATNDAVEAAVETGLIVVVAAGNDAADACRQTPGAAPGAITVGATDAEDAFAAWSNFGPCVDLLAPGVDILSVGLGARAATRVLSGTSMACPLVAGVAAQLLEKHGLNRSAAVAELLSGASAGLVSGVPPGTPNLLVRAEAGALGAGAWPPPRVIIGPVSTPPTTSSTPPQRLCLPASRARPSWSEPCVGPLAWSQFGPGPFAPGQAVRGALVLVPLSGDPRDLCEGRRERVLAGGAAAWAAGAVALVLRTPLCSALRQVDVLQSLGFGAAVLVAPRGEPADAARETPADALEDSTAGSGGVLAQVRIPSATVSAAAAEPLWRALFAGNVSLGAAEPPALPPTTAPSSSWAAGPPHSYTPAPPAPAPAEPAPRLCVARGELCAALEPAAGSPPLADAQLGGLLAGRLLRSASDPSLCLRAVEVGDDLFGPGMAHGVWLADAGGACSDAAKAFYAAELGAAALVLVLPAGRAPPAPQQQPPQLRVATAYAANSSLAALWPYVFGPATVGAGDAAVALRPTAPPSARPSRSPTRAGVVQACLDDGLSCSDEVAFARAIGPGVAPDDALVRGPLAWAASQPALCEAVPVALLPAFRGAVLFGRLAYAGRDACSVYAQASRAQALGAVALILYTANDDDYAPDALRALLPGGPPDGQPLLSIPTVLVPFHSVQALAEAQGADATIGAPGATARPSAAPSPAPTAAAAGVQLCAAAEVDVAAQPPDAAACLLQTSLEVAPPMQLALPGSVLDGAWAERWARVDLCGAEAQAAPPELLQQQLRALAVVVPLASCRADGSAFFFLDELAAFAQARGAAALLLESDGPAFPAFADLGAAAGAIRIPVLTVAHGALDRLDAAQLPALWIGAGPPRTLPQPPRVCVGTLCVAFLEAAFGPRLPEGEPVHGPALLYAADPLLCSSPADAAPFAGKIVLIRRGECNFQVKVARAEAKGALAAIVMLAAEEELFSMAADQSSPEVHIPAVLVGKADGDRLVQLAAAANGATARLGRFRLPAPSAAPSPAPSQAPSTPPPTRADLRAAAARGAVPARGTALGAATLALAVLALGA